jgi:hypothetical protein
VVANHEGGIEIKDLEEPNSSGNNVLKVHQSLFA